MGGQHQGWRMLHILGCPCRKNGTKIITEMFRCVVFAMPENIFLILLLWEGMATLQNRNIFYYTSTFFCNVLQVWPACIYNKMKLMRKVHELLWINLKRNSIASTFFLIWSCSFSPPTYLAIEHSFLHSVLSRPLHKSLNRLHSTPPTTLHKFSPLPFPLSNFTPPPSIQFMWQSAALMLFRSIADICARESEWMR